MSSKIKDEKLNCKLTARSNNSIQIIIAIILRRLKSIPPKPTKNKHNGNKNIKFKPNIKKTKR